MIVRNWIHKGTTVILNFSWALYHSYHVGIRVRGFSFRSLSNQNLVPHCSIKIHIFHPQIHPKKPHFVHPNFFYLPILIHPSYSTKNSKVSPRTIAKQNTTKLHKKIILHKIIEKLQNKAWHYRNQWTISKHLRLCHHIDY